MKLGFVILPGLCPKGVACAMSKLISDGLINSLNVGSFWKDDPFCLLFWSLKRDVEQFISSTVYTAASLCLGLARSDSL